MQLLEPEAEEAEPREIHYAPLSFLSHVGSNGHRARLAPQPGRPSSRGPAPGRAEKFWEKERETSVDAPLTPTIGMQAGGRRAEKV